MQISTSNAIGGGGGAKGGGTPSFSNVNSFTFDGVDEYFDGVGTYSEIDGLDNFAFSFWIKPDTLIGFRQILTIGTNSADNRNQQIQIAISSGKIQVYVSSTSYYWYSTTSLTQDVWQHILVTRDASRPINQKGKVYINSVDESNSDNTRYWTNNATSNSGLMIGRHNNGWASLFSGKIDEVAVYTQDMASYISEIYGGGEAVDLNNLATAPQPTTWHRMGENATWNGSIWAMTDVNGGYISDSVFMVEANRTTDVPPNPSFANTKSILLDGMDDLVSFSQVTYTGEFTTSFWIKPVSLGNNRFLVGREANSDYVWLKTSSEIRVRINFSTYIFSEGSGNDINTGAWNHLLISRDSSNNVSLFLNGAPFSTSQVGAGNHRLDQIGKVGANYYDGNIDETAFWDSDQSSNLATIYNSGVPNDISSLSPTLWYRMGDGDTAPTLTDNGSGGNDGTMVFFNTFSTDVPT